MMEITLSEAEIRVLGALMEKELTTPDYYPLSLNALKNACNQSTNRDPIVSYDDAVVNIALDGLIGKNLAWNTHSGRVTKYGQNLDKHLNLVPREIIVLSLLFLRGPQTVGELRGRSGRAYAFTDLSEVQEVLENLMEWGHVAQLPRQAGRKEPRYHHLCPENPSNDETLTKQATLPETRSATSNSEKITALESELKQLREEFDTFKKEFQDFKDQF